jgi:hypothetical protein
MARRKKETVIKAETGVKTIKPEDKELLDAYKNVPREEEIEEKKLPEVTITPETKANKRYFNVGGTNVEMTEDWLNKLKDTASTSGLKDWGEIFENIRNGNITGVSASGNLIGNNLSKKWTRNTNWARAFGINNRSVREQDAGQSLGNIIVDLERNERNAAAQKVKDAEAEKAAASVFDFGSSDYLNKLNPALAKAGYWDTLTHKDRTAYEDQYYNKMLDVIKNNDFNEKYHTGISKDFYDKIKANPEQFLSDIRAAREKALIDGVIEGSEMNNIVRDWGINPMTFYGKRIIPQEEIDAQNAAVEKALKDREDLIARKQAALGKNRRPLEGLEENWDVNNESNWGYTDDEGNFLNGALVEWHKGLGPEGIYYKGKKLEENKNPFLESEDKTAYDWYEEQNAKLNNNLRNLFNDGTVANIGEYAKNQAFLRASGISPYDTNWANITNSLSENAAGRQLFMFGDKNDPRKKTYRLWDPITKTYKPVNFEVRNGEAFIDNESYGPYNRVGVGGYNRSVPNELTDKTITNNTGTQTLNLGRKGQVEGQYVDDSTFIAKDGTTYKKSASVGVPTWRIVRAKHGSKINIQKIKKFQRGGQAEYITRDQIDAANNYAQHENIRTANTGEIATALTGNGGIELSKLDKWKLGTLATELAGLTASVTGLGSGVAGTLGVGATLSNLGTDIADEKVSGWQAAKNAALGLGLDALTFLPGFGVGAKAAKIGKLAKGASRALGAYFAAKGMGAGMEAIRKLNSDEKMTLDDYRMLLAGVQGVLGAGHLGAQMGAQKKGAIKGATLDVNGKTVKFEDVNKAQDYVKKQKAFSKKYEEVKNMDKTAEGYGKKVRELAAERSKLAKEYGKENIGPNAQIETKFGLNFGLQTPLGRNEAGKLRPRLPFGSVEKAAKIKPIYEKGTFAMKGDASNNMIQEASARWNDWFNRNHWGPKALDKTVIWKPYNDAGMNLTGKERMAWVQGQRKEIAAKNTANAVAAAEAKKTRLANLLDIRKRQRLIDNDRLISGSADETARKANLDNIVNKARRSASLNGSSVEDNLAKYLSGENLERAIDVHNGGMGHTAPEKSLNATKALSDQRKQSYLNALRNRRTAGNKTLSNDQQNSLNYLENDWIAEMRRKKHVNSGDINNIKNLPDADKKAMLDSLNNKSKLTKKEKEQKRVLEYLTKTGSGTVKQSYNKGQKTLKNAYGKSEDTGNRQLRNLAVEARNAAKKSGKSLEQEMTRRGISKDKLQKAKDLLNNKGPASGSSRAKAGIREEIKDIRSQRRSMTTSEKNDAKDALKRKLESKKSSFSDARYKSLLRDINKLQKGGVVKMQAGGQNFFTPGVNNLGLNNIGKKIGSSINNVFGDPDKLRLATTLIGNKKQADLAKKTPKPTLSAPIYLQRQSNVGISSIAPQLNNINASVNSTLPQYSDAKLNSVVNLGMNANANAATGQLYNNIGETNRGIDANNVELANKERMMNAEIANTNAAKLDAYRDMLHKNKQTRLASDVSSISGYLLGKSQEKAQAKRYADAIALEELSGVAAKDYENNLKANLAPYKKLATDAGVDFDNYYLNADATTKAAIDEAYTNTQRAYKDQILAGRKKLLTNFKLFKSGGKVSLEEKKQLAAYNAEMKANQKLADNYNKFSLEHAKDQQKMLNFMLGQLNASQARILKKK